MAGSDDDNEPLLQNAEATGFEVRHRTPRQKVKGLFESDRILGREAYCDVGGINISASASLQSLQLPVEADCIVAIFVIAFDTKAGNLVEWCLPEDADLDGVEFKAMASGSHTLQRDFVYFSHKGRYGLSCFENMPVDSELERGARMKSVGILATSYTLLHRHMQFLETQVRHQLEIPERYGQLKAFWEDKQGVLPASTSSLSLGLPVSAASTPSIELLPEMKITHPAGCFSQFMKFFGEHIFALWKYVLLGKRIIFFSPPPIGVVCYRVYCACCLGNHNLHSALMSQEPKPQFYVNVADIDTLETEVQYIACTTEKIFETKRSLYDVYVDNQNITSHSPNLKDLLSVSDADRDKFQKLINQRNQEIFSMQEFGDRELDEEDMFTNFFMEQNNRLFQTLIDVSASQDRQLTSDHMKCMGLDPVGDRSFLMQLVETYGIDVMLMVDNPCCPR
ncbi:hypothetical protein CAPTEDRAFT_176151 [Capitella teleta]|uniref:DENN domain-containing protein 11 n=1 Tax=Capitella teleta TaxID=283909 RepID=R7TNI6_CAPTE|nr:hypothetical protein CAPTEDRAFT_176151 [Capitella teleta]|eukprot:ELT95107.1 hypothetical protein CAPTEDRAFT_176151 [Capitella teleta]